MSCERRRKEPATTLLHRVFQTHDAPNDIEAPEKSHASVHITAEHVGFTEEAIGDLPGQSFGLVRREYMLRGQFQASHGEKTKRLRRSPYSTRLNYLALVVDGSAPETGHGVMIARI